MRGRLVTRTWRSDPTLYAPARYRRACTYEAFVPDPLNPIEFDLPVELATVVSDAERAIAQLNRSGDIRLRPLARLLLRTESIASSKVEGLQVGIRQLARAEAKVETGGRVSRTVVEVLDNVSAMQLAVEEATSADPVSPSHIAAIHERLMVNASNPEIAGVIRSQQNWIGGNDYNPCGADFVPPPPEEVVSLMDDLCAEINAAHLPPLVQAALVHAQFETIHPFDDGNGRTGRALIHVILRRRELATHFVPPVSVLFAAGRDAYIRGLEDFREGRLAAWIEYFCVSALRATQLAERYLDTVSALTARWRTQLAETVAPRSDAAAWAILEILPGYPVLTGLVAAAATGRSRAPVYQGIEQLVEAGILEQLSTSKRNRSWEAKGLLELMEQLESAGLSGSFG